MTEPFEPQKHLGLELGLYAMRNFCLKLFLLQVKEQSSIEGAVYVDGNILQRYSDSFYSEGMHTKHGVQTNPIKINM